MLSICFSCSDRSESLLVFKQSEMLLSMSVVNDPLRNESVQ